jgi:hypothetical protein
MSILDLKRNDTDGALAYARERLEEGDFTQEDAQQLIMLQDDPEELIKRLNELLEEQS